MTKGLFSKVCLIVTLLAGSLSYGATFTQEETLTVLNAIMGGKTVKNSYGGRSSAITFELDTIEVIKLERNQFEIVLTPHSPGIEIDEITVDGKPLQSLLRK